MYRFRLILGKGLRGQLDELGCQKYLLRGQLERYRRDVGESVHRSEVYEK